MNDARTRGWCSKHYARWAKYGDPTRLTRPFQSACSIDGCLGQATAKNLCSKHYARWQRHGDPLSVGRDYSARAPKGLTESERFWRRVVLTQNGCWEWTGYLTRGYGRFSPEGRNTTVLAHRYLWELLNGSTAMPLDHLCRNRACVNPNHLEPVTAKENARRASDHWHATTTTCKAGLHSYPENQVLEPSTGRTRCRECRRLAQAKYLAKKLTEVAAEQVA